MRSDLPEGPFFVPYNLPYVVKGLSMDSIAVTSRAFSRNPVLRAEIQKDFPHVKFNDSVRLNGGDLVKFLAGHNKAIVSLEVIDDYVLTHVPELRVISKYGVGVDNIDFEALDRHGVKFAWQGGVNRRSVSELTLGFMLSLLRHIPESNAQLKEGKWIQKTGTQLSGKVVGILGCGNVGKDLVKLLKPFECRLLANDIVDNSLFYSEYGVEEATLDTLITQCDIISIHVPCDKSTKNILNVERLNRMKPGAILVNTARGNLVDEVALKSCLMAGHLGGAAFDVFAIEPPTDIELISLPNFLTTPHIGGSSAEAILAMGRVAIEGLKQSRPIAEWKSGRELTFPM